MQIYNKVFALSILFLNHAQYFLNQISVFEIIATPLVEFHFDRIKL